MVEISARDCNIINKKEKRSVKERENFGVYITFTFFFFFFNGCIANHIPIIHFVIHVQPSNPNIEMQGKYQPY